MEMRAGQRFRTKAERREIVEETMKPGVTVPQVARAHQVAENQVYQWRRQYREGWLEEGEKKSTALLPVTITAAVSKESSAVVSSAAGVIDIDMGHAQVRI